MPKFCGKCGSKLNENGLCPNCDNFESKEKVKDDVNDKNKEPSCYSQEVFLLDTLYNENNFDIFLQDTINIPASNSNACNESDKKSDVISEKQNQSQNDNKEKDGSLNNENATVNEQIKDRKGKIKHIFSIIAVLLIIVLVVFILLYDRGVFPDLFMKRYT